MFEFIAFVIVELALLFLVLLVYIKGSKNNTNLYFSKLYTVSALWAMANYLENEFFDIGTAALFLRLDFAIAPAIFYYYLMFFLNFPATAKITLKNKFFLFLPMLFSSIFSFSDLIIKDIHFIEKGIQFKSGVLFLLYALLLVTYAIVGNLKLILDIRKYSGIQRVRIYYVLLGMLLGASIALLINLVIVRLLTVSITISRIGIYALLLPATFTAYAIARYRLMDIRIAFTRAGIFTVVYGLILGIPFVFGYRLLGRGLWYIPLILGVVLASGGPFTYSMLQRRAEARLRREEFKAHQSLNNLAQYMMRFTDLNILLKLIVHEVVKIMKVESSSLYLKDVENANYHLRATWGVGDKGKPEQPGIYSEDSPLLKEIFSRKVPILSEELKAEHSKTTSLQRKELEWELYNAKVALIIPAFKGDELFGFLLLGARRSGRLFTQEDLNLLILLANQAVLAIENAEFFGREKTLLAEKSRRDALADMAPGVAHQFNNRLAAIINSADAQIAVNEVEDLAKLSQEKLISLINNSQGVLQAIEKEALRGKDIANAILKKGRARVAYIEADLAPVIQSAIELYKVTLTRKSLEGAEEPDIIFNVQENLPKIILNESLIQDIFYNLLDNSRDSIIMKHRCIIENKITPDETPYNGKIVIAVEKQENRIVVKVSDNGLGMDEKTKARLFVPYFTTKATALKGTGMGLWVIRSFIEDHKGKISFESEYTKGACFTIAFPCPQNCS